MDLLLLSLLIVTGFVGCAEFGSVALVHPVIRRLPVEDQVVMEKGLLRTYGRVMPVGMTAAAILAGLGVARYGTVWLGIAAAVLTLALVVTILGNVPSTCGRAASRATRCPWTSAPSAVGGTYSRPCAARCN